MATLHVEFRSSDLIEFHTGRPIELGFAEERLKNIGRFVIVLKYKRPDIISIKGYGKYDDQMIVVNVDESSEQSIKEFVDILALDVFSAYTEAQGSRKDASV